MKPTLGAGRAKHTPGPWHAAERGNYDTSGIGIFARNPAGLPYYIARASYMGTADTQYAEANARLIAAAPELLVACERAIDFITRRNRDYHPDVRTAVAILQKAIATATDADA